MNVFCQPLTIGSLFFQGEGGLKKCGKEVPLIKFLFCGRCFSRCFSHLFPLCSSQHSGVRIFSYYFINKQTGLGRDLSWPFSQEAAVLGAKADPPSLPGYPPPHLLRGCGQWYLAEPLAVTHLWFFAHSAGWIGCEVCLPCFQIK